MKVLSAPQIREVDAFTIKHEPIASIDLMERASEAFTSWFVDHFSTNQTIGIICGTGNNGGDGLAVARLLMELNYQVSVFVTGTEGSDDFMINFDRLQRLTEIQDLSKKEYYDFDFDVLVDAIFGSGLNRAPEGLAADVIAAMNHADAAVVSIDIASGLFCDQRSPHASIVNAQYTVSFQFPKLAFFLPENESHVGHFHVADIGLDHSILDRMVTHHHLVTDRFVKPLIKARNLHTHKGSYGKGAIMAGSYGKMGAAVLAATAFMRTGGGLLTVYAPSCGYTTLQTCVPEAMFTACGEEHVSDFDEGMMQLDAVGVGPGLGKSIETRDVLARVLENRSKPLVLDADALNIMADHRELLELIPQHSILTPHPLEFERLFGDSENEFVRLDHLKHVAARWKVYIVLKGAFSATATPEGKIYFNSTGNPGMATGGSGDALTGIITSLLGQGQTPFHAAVLGVYLHGLAGDLAAQEMGEHGMVATDIINFLPYAILNLQETE